MIFCFDTETTGLPPKFAGIDDPRQPRLVQFAGILAEEDGRVVRANSSIVKPDGYEIPEQSSIVHGIKTDFAEAYGVRLLSVLEWYHRAVRDCDLVVAHNADFDIKIMRANMLREKVDDPPDRPVFDTMKETTDLLKLPGRYGYKWPKLDELHRFLFGDGFEGAHDALEDIRATLRCYLELKKRETESSTDTQDPQPANGLTE